MVEVERRVLCDVRMIVFFFYIYNTRECAYIVHFFAQQYIKKGNN